MKHGAAALFSLAFLALVLPAALAEEEPPTPGPRRGMRGLTPEAMWDRMKRMDVGGRGPSGFKVDEMEQALIDVIDP